MELEGDMGTLAAEGRAEPGSCLLRGPRIWLRVQLG